MSSGRHLGRDSHPGLGITPRFTGLLQQRREQDPLPLARVKPLVPIASNVVDTVLQRCRWHEHSVMSPRCLLLQLGCRLARVSCRFQSSVLTGSGNDVEDLPSTDFEWQSLDLERNIRTAIEPGWRGSTRTSGLEPASERPHLPSRRRGHSHHC
nr:uncharacterized protein LOC129387000 [Dermacentor andersoni]